MEVPATRKPDPLMVKLFWAVKELFEVVRDAPVETVSTPEAVSWLAWVTLPEIVRVANDWPEERLMVLDAPVNVTVEPVEIMLAMDEEFHEPAMEIVAEPNVKAADAPELVRLELNVDVDEVKVKVPLKVRAPVKVVEIPALTVTLAAIWEILMLPPEAATTTVLVPAVNPPAEVSMLVTVIVEPLPSRMPPRPMVRVAAVRGRLETDVSRLVVLLPSLTWIVVARRPRVARVKV